jgi:hypothetical protein
LHRLRFFEIARLLNFGVSLPELMAACAARGPCAACYEFGFVRNGAATAFHVFYRFQVTGNFDDAPLLQSAPNRPDYIHIWALRLHGHRSVTVLEWQTDRVIANIFIALPLFEIALVLVRLDHRCPLHSKRESPRDVSGCKTSRNQPHC